MSTSTEKFYNLYFLSMSAIWSMEYDLEYEKESKPRGLISQISNSVHLIKQFN